MSQWERLNQLDSASMQKLDDLYNRDEFPMDVRHYLAPWIEAQNWDRAAREPSLAVVLFQVLLENLDNQYSRFVQECERERQGESFLQQRNFRRFKQNLQRYQEEPYTLASIILWFLNEEKKILHDAELAEQVQLLQVHQSSIETDSQRHVEKRLREFKNTVQVMEHTVMSLEEQEDEFTFKYQTHQMEGTTDEAEKREQTNVLQQMINRLDWSRKSLLSGMVSLLDSADSLLSVLVREELAEWGQRQQRACIGAPDDTSLDPLEKWFTLVAEGLFQLRQFLRKLDELTGKFTYESDPIKAQKLSLQNRVDNLLTTLLKSAFVVETQPSMPQGKGPLVLRTNVQFSVKARFLVKVPELNHAMKVTVSIDKEAPQVKGYRRFNVLGTYSKALNMAESMSGGMVADFRHLILKEQKAGGGKGINDLSLSVTEELHIMNFDTVFDLHGLSITLEATSLPVVVISNSSQQQSAWASVLWFNMLCTDPKNVLFLASSPVATWQQLGEMLSWQFLSCAKRGLDSSQLDSIALKLFGRQQNYETCKISWAKFSKENMSEMSFTYWVWLDGILSLVKAYLADLWSDGSIMGFVSKGKEKSLLKTKQNGTFLLRFSESIRDGGVTFSWVEYNNGKPNVRSVQPFTKTDLCQIPFAEIIRNFQILEAENVPENPLRFLYPNTSKEEAFGKYYSEKSGDDSPYIKYIKTKLVFVSKENGCSGVAEGRVPRPHSGEASGPNGDPLLPEVFDGLFLQSPDTAPMLSGSDTLGFPDSAPDFHGDIPGFPGDILGFPDEALVFPDNLSVEETDLTLLEYLNNPNLLDGPFLSAEEVEQGDFLSGPDHTLQELGFPATMPLTP